MEGGSLGSGSEREGSQLLGAPAEGSSCQVSTVPILVCTNKGHNNL